ncbi:hypothetical protein CRG98_015548 [Punica granatum]|uniref:Dehydrodolichyl diphosphate synthase 2-like n=1 Tax=Punica granatum TaxID=22663 RepID=A0A2I0K6C6_PUNGR|nr:hypothetical protein CRG98_015548 [Punica granatum]
MLCFGKTIALLASLWEICRVGTSHCGAAVGSPAMMLSGRGLISVAKKLLEVSRSPCPSTTTQSNSRRILLQRAFAAATSREVYGGGSALTGDSAKVEPLPSGLRHDLMPRHVAVIMDGNSGWARRRGLPVSSGHEEGMRSLWELTVLCGKWGITVLTAFLFSYENWSRPKVSYPACSLASTNFKNNDALLRSARVLVRESGSGLVNLLVCLIRIARESPTLVVIDILHPITKTIG